MRGQVITIEYILIILLSLSLLGMSYDFLKNHANMLESFLRISSTKDKIKLLDVFLYNLEGMYYAKQQFSLDNVRVFCQNNITIIQTEDKCTSSPQNLPYQGDLITINNKTFVYSNRTNVYYPAVHYGYFLLKSCYEGYDSFIINTSSCNAFCIGKCTIYIIKNQSKIIII